jgi:two-component system, NarL family, nitrate/nitrite response regulator NarL
MLTEVQATLTGAREAASGIGEIRIAIADDHPIFRDALCRLLSFEEDFRVVAQLDDGSQVLDALQECEPDILLLDLNMPGLSGLGALQLLQAAETRTRIILLTASDNLGEFAQALKLGSCGIVQKQTATDQLIQSIRRVHNGEMWIDPRTTAAAVQGMMSAPASPPAAFLPYPAQPRGRMGSLLSQRQMEVVHMATQGFKNSDIAVRLALSEQTVKNHMHNIFERLEVTDRLELALLYVAEQVQMNAAPAGRR